MTSKTIPLTCMPDRNVMQDRLILSRVKEAASGRATHVVELHRMKNDRVTDPSEVKRYLEVLFVEVDDERAIANLRDELIAYCKECQIQ
jgi:hypothetical protein